MIVGHSKEKLETGTTAHATESSSAEDSDESESDRRPRPGQGRHTAADYQGAERIEVLHDTLQLGDSVRESSGRGGSHQWSGTTWSSRVLTAKAALSSVWQSVHSAVADWGRFSKV